VVEAVLSVIDLDPASPGATKPLVVANRYFTIEDDGLAQDWIARTVFLNPPYGRDIGRWTRKLSLEHRTRRTLEFVALLPARVDTRWWRDLLTDDMLVCFIDHRLRFLNAEWKPTDPAMFPSALVYGPALEMGRQAGWEDFANHTKHLGCCWRRF